MPRDMMTLEERDRKQVRRGLRSSGAERITLAAEILKDDRVQEALLDLGVTRERAGEIVLQWTFNALDYKVEEFVNHLRTDRTQRARFAPPPEEPKVEPKAPAAPRAPRAPPKE